MNAFAGASVPAAVVIMGSMRGSAFAPSITALNPASVACELSASIPCARVLRGTRSIARASTRRAASRASSEAFCPGASRPTSSAPSGIASVSESPGRCTRTTTAAPSIASRAFPTTSAPAEA